MHHCYISREHGLIFGALDYLLRWVFEPANFKNRRAALTFAPAAPPTEAQSVYVESLIHLPNEDVRPGNLKPSHILASRVAGLKDCAPSPGLLILHFFHAFS